MIKRIEGKLILGERVEERKDYLKGLEIKERLILKIRGKRIPKQKLKQK